jgi:hypothetical protein
MVKSIKITMNDGEVFEFTNCDYSYNETLYYVYLKDGDGIVKKYERFPIRNIYHIV